MGSDDDIIIRNGKLSYALNYYIKGVKLWHVLLVPVALLAAYVAGRLH